MTTPAHAVPMDDKLARLATAYAEAQAAVKAATERKDSLGAELKMAAEEALVKAGLDPDTKTVLEGPDLKATVTTTTSWRIDTTKLKAEQPVLYAAYAKQSTSKRLTVTPA